MIVLPPCDRGFVSGFPARLPRTLVAGDEAVKPADRNLMISSGTIRYSNDIFSRGESLVAVASFRGSPDRRDPGRGVAARPFVT
jgi:hypothetical protein